MGFVGPTGAPEGGTIRRATSGRSTCRRVRAARSHVRPGPGGVVVVADPGVINRSTRTRNTGCSGVAPAALDTRGPGTGGRGRGGRRGARAFAETRLGTAGAESHQDHGQYDEAVSTWSYSRATGGEKRGVRLPLREAQHAPGQDTPGGTRINASARARWAGAPARRRTARPTESPAGCGRHPARPSPGRRAAPRRARGACRASAPRCSGRGSPRQ